MVLARWKRLKHGGGLINIHLYTYGVSQIHTIMYYYTF